MTLWTRDLGGKALRRTRDWLIHLRRERVWVKLHDRDTCLGEGILQIGLPALSWRPGAVEVDARLSPPFQALLEDLRTLANSRASPSTAAAQARKALNADP